MKTRRLAGALGAAVMALGLLVAAPATAAPAAEDDQVATPMSAEVEQRVEGQQAVDIVVATELPDGSLDITTRPAVGPDEANAVIASAAQEPDVVAVDVDDPVYALAGDPYRRYVEVPVAGGIARFLGQYGLDMLCTDQTAGTDWNQDIGNNNRCNGSYSYQYATGTGSVIAILDEPVQAAHPDLAANTYEPYECRTDKLTADQCVKTSYTAAQASEGHGNHVTGIAAAVTDNGIGVAGQAKGALSQPMTVLDNGGAGFTSSVARGIDQAVQLGVSVINMSLGGPSDNLVLRETVQRAYASGVTMVASAGNLGPSGAAQYPAAYDEVIAVGAIDNEFTIWSGSNWGDYVDVVAPGAGDSSPILSTETTTTQCVGLVQTGSGVIEVLITTGYCYKQGTSMAAPFVSGLVAQIKQINKDLTPAQVKSLLTSTALDLGSGGWDPAYGFGMIRPVQALQAVPLTPSQPLSLGVAPGNGQLTVGFTPPSQTFGQAVLRYEYQLDDGAWVASPRKLPPVTITGLSNGTEYGVRLRAVTSAGPGAPSEQVRGTPSPPTPTQFVPVDPFRAYDSRWSAVPGVITGPLSAADGGRLISVRDSRDGESGAIIEADAVPVDATAIAFNLTATGQTTSGLISLTPGDVSTAPSPSTINWTRPQQTVANGYVVSVDTGEVRAFVGGRGSTQFVIDVVGYYVPTVRVVGESPANPPEAALSSASEAQAQPDITAQAVDPASVFVPLSTPARMYDSRWSATTGLPVGALPNPDSRTIPVKDGRNNSGGVTAANVVPAGATAIAYNLTITGTSGGSGFLAVTPAGSPPPTASTINWIKNGQTIANATTVQVSADRQITISNPPPSLPGQRTTEFLIDVVGYFIPPGEEPAGVTGSEFVAIPPTRSYDSRWPAGLGVTVGLLSGGQNRVTSAALDKGVPSVANAVAFNLTITGNSATGFLTVAPGDETTIPAASLINWGEPVTTLANGSVVGVDSVQRVRTFAVSRGGTQYLIDIAGYYQPPAG